MKRLGLLVYVLFFVFASVLIVTAEGSKQREVRPPFGSTSEPAATESLLTARAAFAALVERRNAPDGGVLKQLEFTELAGTKILVKNHSSPPGCLPSWSPVRLYLQGRAYEFVRAFNNQAMQKAKYSPPAWYRGDFTWQDGKWVASPARSAKTSIR